MKRASAIVAGVLALSFAAAAGAQPAQVPSGPAPGAGDSSRISNSDRESMSDYNRLAGDGVKTRRVNDDKPRATAAEKPIKATAADIQVGAALRAIDGPQIATIVSVSGDQVVVDTGETKIGVPLLGFGKDSKGLVLNMTSAKFKDAVEKAHAANAAADAPKQN